MNLPIHRKRIDAGVREAQNRAMSNSRKYDRLKDETIENVTELFASVDHLHKTLTLFRSDIIPKQELTLNQSLSDYRVTKVDSLQVIENWRQLFQFHITEKRFEADLNKALASLARQIGGFALSTEASPVQPPLESPPEPLQFEESTAEEAYFQSRTRR